MTPGCYAGGWASPMKVSNKVAKVVLPLSAGLMLTSFTVLGIGVVTSFGILAYQVYLYLVRGVWE